MNIIVYDTETSGLPLFKEPSEDPRQPHLVELAASLYDDTGARIDGFSTLIKPDGWESGPEALAAHGITHEMALADGIPESEALSKFLALHARAGLRVAHNESFDARIIRIAIMRYADPDECNAEAIADAFRSAPAHCTCNAAKPILKLPPTDRMKKAGFGRSFKAPNLGEAYEHFTGQKIEGAHRAHVDVAACAQVYFAMKKRALEAA